MVPSPGKRAVSVSSSYSMSSLYCTDLDQGPGVGWGGAAVQRGGREAGQLGRPDVRAGPWEGGSQEWPPCVGLPARPLSPLTVDLAAGAESVELELQACEACEAAQEACVDQGGRIAGACMSPVGLRAVRRQEG